MLLVLDNFEHLIEGASLLLDILRRAPEIKIVVTSRERLHVQAEWVFDVQGLAFPGERVTGRVEDYSAVQLFCERVRRVDGGFSLSAATTPAAVRVCQLVEGMPLGVELAAASAAVFSCEQIAAQIARNLDSLATTMRDVPERHRSVRAVFEHSWNLLSEDEQRVFRKLAVFRGGFQARAAQEVAGASAWILSALVSKSLVRRTPDDRYEMHELLKQYAAEKLGQHLQERDQTQDHHCEYYAEFLYQRAEQLIGKQQKESLAEINDEIENVRAAWQQAVARRKDVALEKSILSLKRFYEIRSWFQEGLSISGRAATSLEIAFGPVDQITGRKAVVLGLLLSQQGWYSHRLGLPGEAQALLQKSLAILRRQGIRRELAMVLNESGVVAYRAGDYMEARQLYEESIAVCRKLDERRELAVALSNLGNVYRALGEYEQARKFLRESVDVFREHGDQYSMAVSLNNLGEVFRAMGNRLKARQCYQEGLTVRREIGDQMGIAVSLTNLGGVAQVLGEYEESKRLSQESLDIFVELKNRREIAYPLHILGLAARDLGEYDEALAYYQEALKICQETQHAAKALDILKDVSFLLVKKGEKKRAAELVAMILRHSATQKETRRNAKDILSELTAELPSEVVATAQERGQKQKLQDVMREIIDQT
jgi:predicted ATPase